MRHPTEGLLRRLVDDPAGVPDADRGHVAGCTQCLADLAAARHDASVVAGALEEPAGASDADAAWHRLSAATESSAAATESSAASPEPSAAAPRRRLLRSPVVAAVGVAALLAGGGAAAAGDWFQIFRTERVVAVTFSEADLVRLPDLSSYGDLQVTQEPRVTDVADAATAAKQTGLTVPRVARLPRGVTGDPVTHVGTQATAEFTFSAAKARAAAQADGQTLPTPPAGLDGGRLRITAGPGVAQVWSEGRGVPALVVARAVAPEGFSSGVPFAEARDYLLSLPGLPPTVAAQLEAVGSSTLPIPLPQNAATTHEDEVDGHPATVFESEDGLTSGVVWVQGGVVTAVAGSLSSDEVLSVARGLR